MRAQSWLSQSRKRWSARRASCVNCMSKTPFRKSPVSWMVSKSNSYSEKMRKNVGKTIFEKIWDAHVVAQDPGRRLYSTSTPI